MLRERSPTTCCVQASLLTTWKLKAERVASADTVGWCFSWKRHVVKEKRNGHVQLWNYLDFPYNRPAVSGFKPTAFKSRAFILPSSAGKKRAAWWLADEQRAVFSAGNYPRLTWSLEVICCLGSTEAVKWSWQIAVSDPQPICALVHFIHGLVYLILCLTFKLHEAFKLKSLVLRK